MSKRATILTFIGLCAFTAVVVLWGLRYFMPVRHIVSSSSCINNLRQIEGATTQWALENNKTNNEAVSWENINPYLKNKVHCPQAGAYTLRTVADKPLCSIPEHCLDYGVFEVTNESGAPLDALVTILTNSVPAENITASATRMGYIHPIYHIPATISVSQTGYIPQTVPMPAKTNWPLRIIL